MFIYMHRGIAVCRGEKVGV